MKKTYTLRTVEDITKVVNKDNLDNFLIDFRMFLEMTIKSKPEIHIDSLADLFKGKVKIAHMDKTYLKWQDDNKHDKIKTYIDDKGKTIKTIKV